MSNKTEISNWVAKLHNLPDNPVVGEIYNGKRFDPTVDNYIFSSPFIYKKDEDGDLRWHTPEELLPKGKTTSELYAGQFYPELMIVIGALIITLIVTKWIK